jgi:hypothetical protein
MEEEELKVSKYSSGINILKRVDELWKDTHKHSREGNFSKWNDDLDRIWLELARDLKDKPQKPELGFGINNNKFNSYDELLAEEGDFEDNPQQGFRPLNKNQISKRNKHYKILMEKQLFLARLENAIGKGTTLEDEDDDDY